MKISPICFSVCSTSFVAFLLFGMLRSCHAHDVDEHNAKIGGLQGVWNVVSGKQAEEVREDEGYAYIIRVFVALAIASGVVGFAAREKGA